MRVAFDTNVLLDVLITGRTGSREAVALLRAMAEEKLQGVLTANSITDIYYIARKYLGDSKTRKAIYGLMALFEVIEVTMADCMKALGSPMDDFEDALLSVCADRCGALYIVSRDEGLISSGNCLVNVVRPAELLDLVR